MKPSLVGGDRNKKERAERFNIKPSPVVWRPMLLETKKGKKKKSLMYMFVGWRPLLLETKKE